MFHLFGWGENEPIIAPASDGGDRTNVFAVKVKALFASLFDDLNDCFDEISDTYLPLAGGTLTGEVKTRNITPSTGSSYDLGSCAKPYNTVHANEYHIDGTTGSKIFTLDDDGIMPVTGGGIDIGSSSLPIGWLYAQNISGGSGTFTTLSVTSGITGNASSATKLATKRSINGTLFDGTGNITTALWGTARNVYIQDATASHTGVAVSVNGSSAVNLKLPSTIKATLEGNASSATKLATARTLNLSGAVTADGASFNGTGNATINVKTLDASKLTGTIPRSVISTSVSGVVIQAGSTRSIDSYTTQGETRANGYYITVTGNGTSASPYKIGLDYVYDSSGQFDPDDSGGGDHYSGDGCDGDQHEN